MTGVQNIPLLGSGPPVTAGRVDVGKHLRPAYRNHRVVVPFVRPVRHPPGPGPVDGPAWQAVKLA